MNATATEPPVPPNLEERRERQEEGESAEKAAVLMRAPSPPRWPLPGHPGRLPARGSHRSVRASLTHTARPIRGWQPAQLSAGVTGTGVPRFEALVLLPSNESLMRHPLPSPGSRRVQFSWFPGTMECSDALSPFSPRFVAFAWRYPPVRLRSSLPRGPTPAGGLELWGWQLRANVSGWETAGRPRFLGNPRVPMPGSPTPAGPAHQAIR